MSARSIFSTLSTLTAPPAWEITQAAETKSLPHEATFLRILGVNYVHLKTDDDGDLYVTEHGFPFIDHLKPENWYAPDWFAQKREPLQGTSTIYRVPSRPIPRHPVKSVDLVVKWSRVGEDVPLDTFTLSQAINAEFNSPFEEFSLLEELRQSAGGNGVSRILTQKPLAIYVPPERMQLWQSGRSRDRILRKAARHASVEIDILRSYILLYAWIDGLNAVEAYQRSVFDKRAQQDAMAKLTNRGNEELREHGFLVADNKPTHFIVRTDDQGQIRRRKNGKIAYALVDYELLARTPEREEAVKAAGRSKYLMLQRARFKPQGLVEFPPHLKPAQVLGVDYIFGRAESTNGMLWVVGKDPELFNYFLPERWRHKQIQLSRSNRAFYTQTKDRIHFVWKISRVGDIPPGDLADPHYLPLLMQGYNSPFEEFALALEMQAKGIKTTYPRAIYVTGQPSGAVLDERRYERMRHVLSPEGSPVLQPEPDYISIWGYWRGLEDLDAPEDTGFYVPIDAAQACNKGIVSAAEFEAIVARHRDTLAAKGFEDVNLKGDHIMLSYRPGGSIKRDAHGDIELRHSNMEMVRRIPTNGR